MSTIARLVALSLSAAACLPAPGAFAESISGCVDARPIADEHCIGNDALTVVAENTCSSGTYHVRICIDQRSGKASCGSDYIGPHRTFTYYACEPQRPFRYRATILN